MDLLETHLAQAGALIVAGRSERAVELLAQHPEDAEARLLSAIALSQMKDFKRGLVEVERSIALRPENVTAHAIRSDVLLHLDRKRPAVDAAREAVRIDPDEPIAHIALARAAAKTRAWKLAENAASEALRLAPESSEANEAAGYVALLRGRRKVAAGHLAEAARIDPSNPFALNNLAMTGSRFKPYTHSVELLEAAVATDPSNEVITDNLYLYTSAHVQGHGFDRLDLWFYLPALVSGAVMMALLFGWIRAPALVIFASLVVTMLLIVLFSVVDFMRNRRRLLSVRQSTRSLYVRRFRRDLLVQAAYFIVTFGLPAVVATILASALGLPRLAQLLVLVILAAAWWIFARRLWYSRVRSRLGSKR